MGVRMQRSPFNEEQKLKRIPSGYQGKRASGALLAQRAYHFRSKHGTECVIQRCGKSPEWESCLSEIGIYMG